MKSRESLGARRSVQIVLVAGLAAGNAQAATDVFLRIQSPTILGESQDTKHPGEIIVLSWRQQSLSRSECASLAVVKNVDSSSSALFDAAVLGTVLGTSLLTVRNNTGLEFFKVSLQNSIISSLSQRGASVDNGATEEIVLTPVAYTTTFRPQNPDGSAGTPVVKSSSCVSTVLTGVPPK